VRLVHLGLGNFHRAHQAWYTSNAPDASEWGIAAFTGRRPDAAEQLGPQDGLYTLITRSADGDTFAVIQNLVAVHPSTDHPAYLDYLRRPEVAVVTITVTEAGYVRRPDGHLDVDRDTVAGDIAALRTDADAPVASLPGRLVAGLLARRAADAGPITILSCDNLPENGEVTATVVTELAAAVDETLPDWIAANVDFATSMVDRITPATTDEDRRLVAGTQGYDDAAPVPTEPYAEWVVAGRFPAGRPRWEDAGAKVVADVGPYEQRKLWLLNGSHSLLAYAGSIGGHSTIDEAIGDSRCREWVERFWDEASRHLLLGPAGPLRQPPGPAPAGPDRPRRVDQAAGPDHPDPSGRAHRWSDAGRLRHRPGGLGSAPARAGRPGQGSRGGGGPRRGRGDRSGSRRLRCPRHARRWPQRRSRAGRRGRRAARRDQRRGLRRFDKLTRAPVEGPESGAHPPGRSPRSG
jgi:hypothetical protein